MLLLIFASHVVRADVLSTLLPEYKAYDAYLQSQYDVACDEYSNLLESDPYNPQGNYNVGTVLYKKGDVQNSEQYFKRAVEHAQDNVDLKEQALFNLGNSYMKIKKYQDAIDSYENVLQLNEHNDKAVKNLEIAKRLLELEQQKDEEQRQQKDQGQQQDKQDSQNQEQKQDSQQGAEQEQGGQNTDKTSQSSNQENEGNSQKQSVSNESKQQSGDDKQKEQQSKSGQEKSGTEKQEEQKRSLDQERQGEQEESAKQKSSQQEQDQQDQSLKQGDKLEEQREKAEKQMKDANQGLEKKEHDERQAESGKAEPRDSGEKLKNQSEQGAKDGEQKEGQTVALSNQYAEQMDADVAHDDRLDKKDIRLLKLLSEQEDSIHKQLLKMNVSKQGTEKHGQKNW